jgi:hypothetical protein
MKKEKQSTSVAGRAASTRTSSAADKPTSARLLGNRPLDPASDNVDVRPPNLKEAEAQIKTPDLLADPQDAVRPVAVQNGRFLATYIGCKLERDKDQEKLVHLQFSIALQTEHDGYLPKKVKLAWDYLIQSHDKLVQVAEIPAVTLDLYVDTRDRKPLLHLVGAEFSKAIVGIFEETGKGKLNKVTRFAFRLLVERDEKTMHFAAWNDGEQFWITMPPTQKSIV